ncbi:MAG: hypothetical protein ABJB49_10410 [Nitrospirota bacterium]
MDGRHGRPVQQRLEDPRWEDDIPKGTQFRVAMFTGDGMHVTDIWDSPEDFANFQRDRLTASIQQAGIQGQPDVVIAPVHRLFTPGFAPKK